MRERVARVAAWLVSCSQVVVQAFISAWFPFSVSAVATFALAQSLVSGQITSSLQSFVAARALDDVTDRKLIVLGLVYLVLFLAFVVALRVWSARHLGGSRYSENPHEDRIRYGLILIATYAPTVAFVSLAQRTIDAPSLQLPDLSGLEGPWPYLLVFVAVVTCEVALVLTRRHVAQRRARGERLPNFDLALTCLVLGAVVVAAVAFSLGDPARKPGPDGYLMLQAARWIGPTGLALVFLAALTWTVGWLIAFGRRHQWPLFSLFSVWGLVLAGASLNENHVVGELPQSTESAVAQPAPPRPSSDDQAWIDKIEAWKASRTFGDEDGDPIVIVSAEGGGVRAAYFTGVVLSRFADKCPRLADRIFAISGISGGSFGAAFYAADLRNYPLSDEPDRCDFSDDTPGKRELRMARTMQGDHLSPLLARWLFAEPVQSLIPRDLVGTDRQRGLELSFLEAYHGERPGKSVSPAEPFEDFEPKATARSSLPYLILNTTEVETGLPVVATTLPMERGLDGRFRTFVAMYPDRRFSLMSMASTSARFPLISPSGVLVSSDGKERHYVDGGYYDDSGVEAAYAVYRRLSELRRNDKADGKELRPIYMIHLVNTPVGEQPSGGGFDDVLSPVRGFFNARTARMRDTRLRADADLNAVDPDLTVAFAQGDYGDVFLVIRTGAAREAQPLGWHYSPDAACAVQAGLNGRLRTYEVLVRSRDEVAEQYGGGPERLPDTPYDLVPLNARGPSPATDTEMNDCKKMFKDAHRLS